MYIDSSALVKRYIHEDGTEVVNSLFLDATELIASSVCIPEIASAAARRGRCGELDADQHQLVKSMFFGDLRGFMLVAVDERIVSTSVDMVEKHPLKALDSIQLASAIAADPDLFVCSDGTLIDAARQEGLAVFDPVSDSRQA